MGWGSVTTSLSAVTATTTSGSVATSAATAVAVHVVSASSSVATVTIELSLDGTFWYVVATITNPTSTGEIWMGPSAPLLRVKDTHTSGTVSAFVTLRNIAADPVGAEWKKVTTDLASIGTASASIFKGGEQDAVTAMAVDGAVPVAPGTTFATKAGVLAMTLALPTVSTHDGYVLSFVAKTANANTITTPSNGINGNKSVATFGGAVGDGITLEAYQGVWYPKSSINITLS